MKLSKSKNKEFYLLLLWNIPAFLLSFVIGVNYMVMALLFFVVPALYLTYRRPILAKKSALVSIAFTVIFVVVVNYLAHADGSWLNTSMVGINFLNFPIDDIFWGIFYFYYMAIFYEYFFDKDRNKKQVPTSLP